MLIAGIVMVAYQAIRHPERCSIKKGDFAGLLLLGLCNIYLTNVLEFWGLQHLTSFKTCFIYSLSPFLSALLSFFLLKETITPKKWLGLLVGCIGFAPILLSQGAGEERIGGILMLSWAELSVLGAATASVFGWILLRRLVNQNGYSPNFANGLSMMIGGIMALAHSAMTENWDPLPVTEYAPFLEAGLALIIISNFICYNLYGYLLKQFSATFMSFAGFTTPIFTALYGWLFLDEIITMPFIISVSIVFFGLTLFYQEELTVKLQATVD